MNSLCSCTSWKVLFFFNLWRISLLDTLNRVDSYFLSGLRIYHSMSFLLLEFCWKICCYFDESTFICDLLLLFCHFQNSFFVVYSYGILIIICLGCFFSDLAGLVFHKPHAPGWPSLSCHWESFLLLSCWICFLSFSLYHFIFLYTCDF
jgi:hypothetical protein